MKIGKAIKAVRAVRGVTQTELSEKTGLSDSYISLLERGKRTPTIDTVDAIARALKIAPSLLVLLAEDPDIYPEAHGMMAVALLEALRKE